MMFQMKRNVETQTNGADRRDLIKRLQLLEMLVDRGIGNAAHHTSKTQIVHREERQIEKYERQSEVNLADFLVEYPSEHFRNQK